MHDLVDIGANLTHDSFDADRAEVIERARRAGVARMIVTGSTVVASRQAARLATEAPDILYATAGVHPHHARDFEPDDLPVLADLAQTPGIVAIGECGLDHFRNYSTPAQQEQAFIAQLDLAAELEMPVFLHQRDAHDAFLAILREFRDALPGGVAHCFTGTRDQLYAYLDLGLYIGITGWICDERRGHALRDAVQGAPLDRLMVETDAPYLLPRDLPKQPSGRRNEPAFLPHIVQAVAHHMGRSVDEVAAATTRNAEALFNLPVRGEPPDTG